MAQTINNSVNNTSGASNTGETNTFTVTNSSNTASSAALLNITVGGSTAADAFTTYTVAGTTNWSEGVDNSDSDAYVIAASTALGTTNVMRVSTAGEINYPLQPAFSAYVNTTIPNVTGDGTFYTIIPDTELFDQNGDFTLASGTFTAPVTGKYQLNSVVSLIGGTAITSQAIVIATSNISYQQFESANAGAYTTFVASLSILTDMDANDTATLQVISTDSGGKIDDVAGLNSGRIRTSFSGYLVC